VYQQSLNFDKIVNENKDKIFNLLFRLTGDYHLSEDLFQETFLKVYNGLRGYKGESKISSWIYSIALNVFRDSIRRKRWRLLKINDTENYESYETVDENNPEKQFIENEEKETVIRKINKLKESLKIPLVLYYIEGLSIHQITEITGKTKDTIKVSLFRARKKLKKDWNI